MARNINGGYFTLRWKILERDNFTCQYCGQYAPNVVLEIDHILPVADGGTDIPENLKTSCIACNRGKLGLRMISNPKRKTKSHSAPNPVLVALEHNPMTAKQIAQTLNRPVGAIRVELTRLKKKGLLLTTPHYQDRHVGASGWVYYSLRDVSTPQI